MKFDLSVPLTNYDGQLFTQPVSGEDGTVVGKKPLTLKNVLESACLNADPGQHNDGPKKMAIFQLLMKVYGADPYVNLSAEELTTIKELVGKQMTIVAVGAVYAALERPVVENKAKE